MEIGAVLGAAPRRAVIRETSDPGDIIILLGGRTGRDGCGGATGSSKVHTTESIETCGAEVQKGNAPTERKIQRMFRREDAEVIRIGALALKLQCVLLPVQSFTIIGNMLTQSIGYSFRATLTAIGKQGLFFIPAILILPGACGILGLQLAQPVADLLTFILTQVIVVMVVKELKGMEKEAQG